MFFWRQHPLRWRLWLLLTFAFVTVAGTATTTVLYASHERSVFDAQRHLADLAHTVASQIDGQAHAGLKTGAQMEGAPVKNLAHRLRESVADLPEVRRCFTYRMTGKGMVYVLDTTFPGDHSGTRGDDFHYLMQPAPNLPPVARTVLTQGSVCVDDQVQVQNGIPLVMAYSAIHDRGGHIVGGVAVACDGEESLLSGNHIRYLLAGSFLIVVILSFGFASLLARQLAPAEPETITRKRFLLSVHSWRVNAFETVLAAILGGVFLSSAFALLLQTETQTQVRSSRALSVRLDRLRTAAEQDLLSKASAPSDVQEIAKQCNLTWITAGYSGTERRPTELALILRRIRSEETRQRQLRERLQDDATTRGKGLSAVFLVACLLSVASLSALRLAARHETAYLAAESDSRRHQIAYDQVAQSLPIGLFTYAHGHIRFANNAWDELTSNCDDAPRIHAFERALHPDDQQRTLAVLNAAWEEGKPFELIYRLVEESGAVRHIDSRGVPIESPDGRIEHLLGFSVDVSARIAAQFEIEARNREVRTTNKLLRQAIGDLEENLRAMVDSLVKAVEAKDPYTAGHSSRVMAYSVRIGRSMGLSPQDLRTLEMGALMHDVGKIGVPDQILTKPARLTPQEFDCIRTHPGTGARMIEGIPTFVDCLPIVRSHHERLNGQGYPDGLVADQIPTLVRIVSVADCFDAMTSTRAYRSGRSAGEAIEELRKDAVLGALDLEIVEILAEIVQREGLLWISSTEQAA